MSRRLRKQFLYGLFYLVFWTIFIGGTYLLFLKPAPSCHDNIQNQKEEGVDCGQVCGIACIPKNIQALERSGSVVVFPIDASHVTLLVRVQNPNTAFAAKNFSYKYEIYDDAGALLTRPIEKSSFIYAGEFKYLIEPNIDVGKSTDINRIVLALDTHPDWVPASDFPKPQLFAQDQRTMIDADKVRVEGVLLNRDALSFQNPELVTLIYSNTGELIGASRTILNAIAPNDTAPFAIDFPPLTNVNSSRTELFISVRHP
jgi:hypothetical protein